MTLADELSRRGRLPLKMDGKRLVFFGVLPREGQYGSIQEAAYRMRKEGMSFEAIGEALFIHRSTADRYYRREMFKLSGILNAFAK